MSEGIQLAQKFLVHDYSIISLMQPSRTTREQEGELCNHLRNVSKGFDQNTS